MTIYLSTRLLVVPLITLLMVKYRFRKTIYPLIGSSVGSPMKSSIAQPPVESLVAQSPVMLSVGLIIQLPLATNSAIPIHKKLHNF